MNTLYTIGPLKVQIAPFNAHEVSQSGSTDYAAKPVVGAEPPLEFVGEGSNELSLSGRIFPHQLGGLSEVDQLEQMRRSGKPQFVMRGDGKPFGWYAITAVSLRSSYLDAHGIGKLVEVSISLRRAQAPAAQSFFSLMAGFL